jgi:hypothetical protein
MWELETTLVLKIPGLSKEQVAKVAKQIIRTIEKRTASGRDKNGVMFKGYSADYMESKVFEAVGKSTQVDLRLTGEMMTDLDILSSSNGKATIGFPDDEARARAHGHITGANGTGKLPVRDFLGVNNDELASAIRRSGVVKTEGEVATLLSKAEVV